MTIKIKDKIFYHNCIIRGRAYQLAKKVPHFGKKLYHKRYGDKKVLPHSDGRQLIINAVKSSQPFMAARFGTSEGRALFWYWQTKIRGSKQPFPKEISYELCTYSGFFPKTEEMMRRWAEEETKACKDLDVLGTMDFFSEEWVVRKLCPQAKLMRASGITPDASGWTSCLEGKKVLVIHPFTDTIQKQYSNHREEIWPNTNTLPKFDLQCIQAVQTIADNRDSRFKDWFEALDYMTDETSKKDFDVALIGCGAYGFQLASKVKQMGKIAIHMGGSLQTMFGIRGSRWDNGSVGKKYNEFWTYPSEEETPKNFEKVENGCYWK